MLDTLKKPVYTSCIHKGGSMSDTVKLREVGNSITATIPTRFAEKSGLKAGDSVTFYLTTDGNVMLKKASVKKKTRYELYLEEFYGKPIEEIEPIYSEELDWGYAVGEEVLDEY